MGVRGQSLTKTFQIFLSVLPFCDARAPSRRGSHGGEKPALTPPVMR